LLNVRAIDGPQISPEATELNVQPRQTGAGRGINGIADNRDDVLHVNNDVRLKSNTTNASERRRFF